MVLFGSRYQCSTFTFCAFSMQIHAWEVDKHLLMTPPLSVTMPAPYRCPAFSTAPVATDKFLKG